jgi:hypothetical protein
MRLGMLDEDEHRLFVEETEEIFKNLTEVSVGHVYFKSHGMPVPPHEPKAVSVKPRYLDISRLMLDL